MDAPSDLDVLLKVSTLIGGVIAVYTFWRTGRLRHAQWLYDLHAKFYETDTYKRMRRITDYETQPEFGDLRETLRVEGGGDLEEALVDYLNFFEFIASLWRLHQLKLREISMIFEYYILRLRDHDFIMAFISNMGFENLSLLIAELGRRKPVRLKADQETI
jgi:hypothetical protein